MIYENISMIGDTNKRFVLEKSGRNPLFILGVNPSTADEKKTDRTICKVMGFCDKWNHDGFVMLNLYPIRSTKPSNLPVDFDSEIHRQNLDIIESALKKYNNPTILLAYGNSIIKRKYFKECLKDILSLFTKYTTSFIHLGELTKMGHPRHPLYVKYDTIPNIFIFR